MFMRYSDQQSKYNREIEKEISKHNFVFRLIVEVFTLKHSSNITFFFFFLIIRTKNPINVKQIDSLQREVK